MSKEKGKALVRILAEELKEWPGRFSDVGQAGDGSLHLPGEGPHVKYTFEKYTLAEDWLGAIVTRDQWEAERAKLSKPKANAQGWIRNRGRSSACPAEAPQTIEVRYRGGDVYEVEASALRWDHIGSGGDIMAWRSIGAEQPSAGKASDARVEKCAPAETSHVEMPAAKYFDGPLQWRDRITEIDRTVEALEEERVSLVQRLADEGLQLISSNGNHSATKLEEWKRLAMINGQKVAAVKAHREKYSSGLKEAVDAVNDFRNEKGFVGV